MDTDLSALHVQVSMAQRNICCLLARLEIDRRTQVSDDNILQKQGVSDLSAFQNS